MEKKEFRVDDIYASSYPSKIQILDDQGNPIKNTEYQLSIGGTSLSGVTDQQGWTEEFPSIGINEGMLSVLDLNYKITFEDSDTDDLDHIKSLLNSLGFDAGIPDGKSESDENCTNSLVIFQEEMELKVTGEINEETKKKLKEIHNIG